MRSPKQLAAAAVAYADLGYRVLPLHHPIPSSGTQGSTMRCSCHDPTCGAIGKHPLTPHGLKDATSDPGQLNASWES
jgi:Bifunctional DNA primase/polymerase, N-terminal